MKYIWLAISLAILIHIILLIPVTWNTIQYAKNPYIIPVIDPVARPDYTHPAVRGSIRWLEEQSAILVR